MTGIPCDWRILFDLCMAEARRVTAIAERGGLDESVARSTETGELSQGQARRGQPARAERSARDEESSRATATATATERRAGRGGARTPVPDSELGGEC